MAFAAASKGAPLAGLLKNLLPAALCSSSSAIRPASSVAATARRLFSSSTGGAPFSSEDCFEQTIGDDEELFFYHLRQGTHPIFSSIPCRGWVSKQDEKAVQVKVEMPGLAAEHVKLWTSPEGLMIKGEGVKDLDDAQDPARYSGRIKLSPDAFELDQAQAQMKDGVLTVTVPRVKVDLGEFTEIKVQ